ncbi:Stemmadenine O-acetyltransferase [Linum grandiflorum]
MALIVEIISEETIRPSSPSPPNLRIHKLSCMDQLSPPRYMPVLYSYVTDKQPFSQKDVVDKLKSSLSTVLVHYYPFAGRYHYDGISIDCNGEGVPFVISHVAGDMLMSLEAPDEARLVQLLPCRPQHGSKDAAGKLQFLAVRVNLFKCGGIAIGICAWHRIADASTLACFAQCWAAICRGDPAVLKVLPGAVVDYTSFFPPQDLRYITDTPMSLSDVNTIHHIDAQSTIVVKRFVFPAEKIALLREKIGRNNNETSRRQPTRVEAISSLVWAATIRLAQQKRKENRIININKGGGFHSAVMVVNLRTRTSPSLPAVCMGNLIQMTETIKWPMQTEVTEENMGDLAGKLGGAVRNINHEYLERLHHHNNSQGYLDLVKSFEEEYNKDDFIMISSSCRYPIYGADFGWGKPTSVHGFSGSNKMVVLLDAADGEGIEAWVTLDEDDMSKFEKDPFLLCYAC